MRQKKIMVAGHISLDITPQFYNSGKQKFSEILMPGKLVHVGAAQVSAGGAVSNTGLALKKLGADVILTAKTGDDLFGNMLREIIQTSRCQSEIILSETESTSYTIVVAPKGCDRAFLHDPGCNDTFSSNDIDWDLMDQIGYFHFGYPTIMHCFFKNEGEELVRLYKRVKERGIITSLDLSSIDPESKAGKCEWDKILKKVLPYVDFFVPSIEELGYMLDKKRYIKWQMEAKGNDIISILSFNHDIKPIAEKALSYGCKAILLKCGAAGMYLKTSSEENMLQVDSNLKDWGNVERFQNSYVPEKVLSATGAGDTSIAAFLKAVIDGCGPKESMQYAAATGACCVTTYDTISGLKSFEELRILIDEGWEEQRVIKE